jgi:radical SAM superfamily enzyme YgiQ (UPF0313 family)
MRITFLRPNMQPGPSLGAMEPLAFAILYGLTPRGVECTLQDEQVEVLDLEAPTDLVAMTVETYTARRAYEIASVYRLRGVPVVMGGFHPTFLPDEAIRFADSVVVGDAEDLWGRVVRDAQKGSLQRVYGADSPPSLAGAVYDRAIFAGKHYWPVRPFQFGRGCRFACDFCSIHAYYGRTLRHRPLPEVAAELEGLRGEKLFLVDDNLFADADQAKALFETLGRYQIRWACQVSVDIARDSELLDLMADNGCVTALIGFESLNPENLSQMGKRWSLKAGSHEEVVRRFRERGIMLYGTFVFGYDQDTPESFDATVDFAIKSKMCLANFNPLTPTPGTRLFDRLRREGRLRFPRWWLDPGFRYGDALFDPKGMTAKELADGCYRARRGFNTHWSAFRRGLDPRANCRSPVNLGLFWVANRVSRREIHRKQGMTLGSGAQLPADPGPLSQDLYRPGS